MRIPKIRRTKEISLVDSIKIVLVAPESELEEVYKEISLTMQKLARKGYCEDGYVIVNGATPNNN